MADDLDRFVLSYSVQLNDSIGRLDKLHEKMSQVKEQHKKGSESAKGFAADLTDELGKAVPGLSAVSKAIRGVGAELSVAAGIVGVLAVGIRSVIDLRNQFNAQRQAGFDLGTSSIRIENWQRQWATRSGGMVSRDQALDGLRKFREMSRAAYTDPSRMGKENIILRRLGVNVGTPGNPTGFNDELSQLATGLQGKSQADVQGIAQATGFSQDWLTTLQKLGPEVGHITALTADEVKARQAAQDNLDRYNESLGVMKNDLTELEIKLGQGVIPALDHFINLLSGVVDVANKLTSHPVDASETAEAPAFGNGNGGKQVGRWGKLGDLFGWNGPSKEDRQKADEEKKKQEQARKDEAAKAEKMAEAQDTQAKQAQQTADQFTLAINQFSAAVGDFAGSAPSIQEVLAAWAGGAGAAAGLSGSSNAPVAGSSSGGARGLRNNNPGNLEYGKFAQAHGATGSDGRFAIFPTMEAGVAAHAALIDSNYLGKGLNTPAAIIGKYAPASENNQAAYLAYLAKAGFGANTVINDSNKAAFNAAQMKFESGYGGGVGGSGGWTKQTIQRNMVAGGIASWLGVPVDQVLRGGVTQRDIAVAVGASEGKLSNEIVGLNTGIATLQGSSDPTSKIKLGGLQAKLRQDQLALQNLQAYGAGIIAGGSTNASDNLPRIDQITQQFNIQSTDPKAVAAEVHKVFSSGLGDAVSEFSTGRKS